jgi:hypothetical protein
MSKEPISVRLQQSLAPITQLDLKCPNNWSALPLKVFPRRHSSFSVGLPRYGYYICNAVTIRWDFPSHSDLSSIECIQRKL